MSEHGFTWLILDDVKMRRAGNFWGDVLQHAQRRVLIFGFCIGWFGFGVVIGRRTKEVTKDD